MTTAIELPTTGPYRLDPERSTVAFRTRHIFGLAPVRGTFRLRDGRITVGDPVTVSATIDARSFHTGLSMRDHTVRSGQYLDAEHHPDITFVSTRLADERVLHGTLTVRGRTAPVEVRIDEVRVDGADLIVSATSRVDRYELGITAMKGMTGRWLTIRLDIVATRQDSMA